MSEPKKNQSRRSGENCCVVGGCSNTNRDGFRIYTIPTDRATVRGWVRFIRNTRSDFNPANYSKVYVCSGHFKLNQFDPSAVIRYRNGFRSCPPSPMEGEFPCIKIAAVNPFPVNVILETTSAATCASPTTSVSTNSSSTSVPSLSTSTTAAVLSPDAHNDESETKQRRMATLTTRTKDRPKIKKPSQFYEKKTKENKLIKWKLLPSKYRCKLCEVLCQELTDMQEHIVQVHNNQQVTKPKRKKNDGDKDTSHVNILKEGLSDFEVSELSIAMRLCPICEQYVTENRIASHLDTHRLKNAMCEVCGTACATLSALRRHKSRCRSANNWYKCEDCDKEYTLLASFRIHRNKEHTNKPKVTKQCEICGKEFASVQSYRKHLPVHMTVKPFECPDCGKGFTQRSNMANHRRVHTGDKPYKCDMCTDIFAHKVSLKTHKKKKHNIDMWKD